VEVQLGLCAICQRLPGKKGLVVDHDHKTGVVRDLLCGPCNTVLGLLGEELTRVRSVEDYLIKHLTPTLP
jgi:hypothetical protein